MDIFAERLKALRKEHSMTLKQVSEALEIPLTTYANYEQGKREPPIWFIVAVCDLFKVSADYIVGRTNDY